MLIVSPELNPAPRLVPELTCKVEPGDTAELANVNVAVLPVVTSEMYTFIVPVDEKVVVP